VWFAGSCGGKSMDSICRMGSVGVTLAEWSVAVLTWFWGYRGLGGKGWRVACFDGALAGWIVGVSVGVRLSSVEGLVNLCSWLVGVHRDLGLDKVGREWLC